MSLATVPRPTFNIVAFPSLSYLVMITLIPELFSILDVPFLLVIDEDDVSLLKSFVSFLRA